MLYTFVVEPLSQQYLYTLFTYSFTDYFRSSCYAAVSGE